MTNWKNKKLMEEGKLPKLPEKAPSPAPPPKKEYPVEPHSHPYAIAEHRIQVLAESNAALKAENEALREKVPGWHTVSELPPPTGVSLLVHIKGEAGIGHFIPGTCVKPDGFAPGPIFVPNYMDWRSDLPLHLDDDAKWIGSADLERTMGA